MILTGQLVLESAGETVHLAPGWLRIEDDRIAHVEIGETRDDADLGSPDHAISPAFCDAHLHLPQFGVIGAYGLTLLDWLERFVFPAEAWWEDVAFAHAMSANVARSLLAHGTAGVAAYATVHATSAQAAREELAAHGLYGMVGHVLMDRGAPPELVRPAAQLLDQTSAQRAAGRLSPAVTPRFAVSCSRELLDGAGRLARESGLPVQTHLAETHEECDLVHRLFGETSYTSVYESAGLLTPRTLLAHAIHINDAERAAIARAGAVAAHCPTANTFLRSGDMPLASHLTAGVRVALGSDVAGGPTPSMPLVARAMIEAAWRSSDAVLTPARAWWQITRGNALAIGATESGVLRAGAHADLVVIHPFAGVWPEPQRSWMQHPDPLGAALFAWDPRWVRATIAAGVVRYQSR
ncbi:MAG: amidohydrolase family protein [Phycisphaerales bacterium]|jgi:guanine deaminase|nr:amidohydrolase family protein [Phycisphaerales bacterium]